jgi:transcriptional regulator with PAS, ATPase and Fis domain
MRDEEDATERTNDTANVGGDVRWVLRGILPGDTVFVPLEPRSIVLGRGEQCNVRLDAPRVSREHAELTLKAGLLSIRDLGSTNGTHVDGQPITHEPFVSGALVRVGGWLGTVEQVPTDAQRVSFSELAPSTWGGPLLARQIERLKAAAKARLPVVLVGKTGAGKERMASAYHHFAGTGRPFHAINCAAIPPSIAEAELFGYRKGAFTGAERSYAGQLAAAHGGTLFLDEVAELPMALQAKLLRTLDSGEIPRLGEMTTSRFDAAVVAACHAPLSELVAAGRFREDLAARLAGLTLTLPSLRERRTDVPALFDMFLRRHSAGTSPPVSTRLYERLCLHDWPGNVRELELLARQLLAMNALEPVLRCSHLPDSWHQTETEAVTDRNEKHSQDLVLALKQSAGNVKLAAKIVGISRQRAYRLIGSRGLGVVVAGTRDSESGESND